MAIVLPMSGIEWLNTGCGGEVATSMEIRLNKTVLHTPKLLHKEEYDFPTEIVRYLLHKDYNGLIRA